MGMFGDDSDKYKNKFEELLLDYTLEEIIEMDDILPAEALYYLFLAGYVKDPFDR